LNKNPKKVKTVSYLDKFNKYRYIYECYFIKNYLLYDKKDIA